MTASHRSKNIHVFILAFALVSALLLAACGQIGMLAGASMEAKSDHRASSVEGARSASVTLEATVSTITINPRSDSQLIDAEVEYLGDLRFESSGTSERTIVLVDDINDFSYNGRPLNWTVSLNERIPLELNVGTFSGDLNLDLSPFTLSGVDAEVSSGRIDMTLPAARESYPVRANASSGAIEISVEAGAQVVFDSLQTSSGGLTLDVGERSTISGSASLSSGDTSVTIGEGSDVEFTFSSSSGDMVFDVPNDAAVRLEVRSHMSGTVNIPEWLERVGDEGDDNEGIWESDGYVDAERRITLIVTSISSGNVEVR